MATTPKDPGGKRLTADEKFQAAKKEIAQRNGVVQREARKLRDADEAAAAAKRRRLDL